MHECDINLVAVHGWDLAQVLRTREASHDSLEVIHIDDRPRCLLKLIQAAAAAAAAGSVIRRHSRETVLVTYRPLLISGY